MRSSKVVVISVCALMCSIFVNPPLALICALAVLYFIFVNRLSETSDMKKYLKIMFVLVFLSQVIISMALYAKTVDTKYYGFSFKGDDYTYGDFGTLVGHEWRRGKGVKNRGELTYYNLIGKGVNVQTYQLYTAFICFLFGKYGTLALLILNCFIHAITMVPAYLISKKLGLGDAVSRLIIFLFLFWPSTYFWALFNFKEPMLLFALFMAIYAYLLVTERLTILRLMNLAVMLIFVMHMRSYVFVILFLGAAGYFLFFFNWRYKKVCVLICLCIAVGISINQEIKGSPLLGDLSYKLSIFPHDLWNIKVAMGNSRTSYLAGISHQYWLDTIVYYPLGLAASLFLPFLIRPVTAADIVANIESIVWWCLMPLLFSGLYMSVKNRIDKTMPLLTVFFGWLSILALTQSNMGTLIRQKSILYYTGFIFIGIAIDKIKKDRAGRIN